MQIRIYAKSDARTYAAEFTPVRTIGKRSIGWAQLGPDGASLRFPVLYCADLPATHNVLTVDDWQAPWTWRLDDEGNPVEYDLADPEAVRDLLSTGSGRFFYAKKPHHHDGGASDLPKAFAR